VFLFIVCSKKFKISVIFNSAHFLSRVATKKWGFKMQSTLTNVAFQGNSVANGSKIEIRKSTHPFIFRTLFAPKAARARSKNRSPI
jgi:hypothetical protein